MSKRTTQFQYKNVLVSILKCHQNLSCAGVEEEHSRALEQHVKMLSHQTNCTQAAAYVVNFSYSKFK